MDNYKFSIFDPPITETTPTGIIGLRGVYEIITGDSLREKTTQIRKVDLKAASSLKKKLPSVTFSMSCAMRSSKGFEKHSGLICLDFDDLENPSEAFYSVILDQDIIPIQLAFLSPSGKGLKVVIQVELLIVEPHLHKRIYEALGNYFRTNMGLKADLSAKDVTRSCFLCWDEKAYWAKAGSITNLNWHEFLEQYSPESKSYDSQQLKASNDTPDTERTFDQIEFERLLENLEDKGIDITEGYHNWIEICWGLIDLYGTEGEEYFHRISRFNANYNADETGEQFKRCLESDLKKSVGERITAATLFAKLGRKQNQFDAAPLKDDLSILLEKSRIDISAIYEEPPICIEIFEDFERYIYGTLGNFSLVIGKPKSRKTTLLSMIIAASLADGVLLDKFQGDLPTKQKRVVYFDTEQSRHHCQKCVKRIARLSEVETQELLRAYSLRRFNTIQRIKLIEHAIQTIPNIGVVVIDGIRDLVSDINSQTEATEVYSMLLRLTEQYNIHIICVLHQNKNDENARGHLGTELTNKAETVLSISKDRKNNAVSNVESTHCRDKDIPSFSFTIDEETGLPKILSGWKITKDTKSTRAEGKISEITEAMEQSMLKEVLKNNRKRTYDNLWREMQIYFQGLGIQLTQSRCKNSIIPFFQRGWLLTEGTEGTSSRKYFLPTDLD